MHKIQRDRATTLLKEQGITHALLADHTNITWLTGFAAPLFLGAHPTTSAPPLLWYAEGEFTLILSDGHADAAEKFGKQDGCSVITYGGHPYRSPKLRQNEMHKTLEKFLSKHAPKSGTIGVEAFYLPADAAWLLRDAIGKAEIRPIDELITPLRAVKTVEELDILRRNFDLTGVGQAAARAATHMAVSEIDVWNAASGAMENAAGERIAMGNDVASGRRKGNVGGPPKDEVLKTGDTILVDLSAVRAGYWSDSCGTYFTTDPTERQRSFYDAALEALAVGKSMLKPGAVARDIDAAVRQVIKDAGFEDYPHHTGHGVGASGHEEPFIMPESETVLEAGMVVMLEPGCYESGEIGVRLEDGFLITEDGCEQLTHHDKGLEGIGASLE